MTESNVTRGSGLLERFLALQRCKMADRLIPPSSRSGRILDVGCGTSPLFLQRVVFSEKVGLDRIPRAARTRGGTAGLTLVDHDIERDPMLPFTADQFDVVTMLAVLEHIDPRLLPVLLTEIHRVLKPGGCYIMTTPAWWTDGLLRVMAKIKLVSAEELAEHKDTYSTGKIVSVMRGTGFSLDRVQFGYFELFMNIWMTAAKLP